MDENKTQSPDKDIKVLRTYTSDMAEAIRDNEMSVIKIAMAEKDKREQEDIYRQAEGTNTSKTFLLIGGIILIAGAIFGSYFLIQKKKESEIPKATINNIETFISYDSKSYIDTTDIKDASTLATLIEKEQQESPSSIKALFLTKNTETSSSLITTTNLFGILRSTAPGALQRSISDKYLLGKYLNEKDKSKPGIFLIFQTTDYTLAYASMLEWEKTMAKDLYLIFNINQFQSSDSLADKPWKDIVINNKDARVLYGDNGEGMLYYVFVNKNNFVITNNIEAMKEVVTRLIVKNANPL